jgi:hypothetical protein
VYQKLNPLVCHQQCPRLAFLLPRLFLLRFQVQDLFQINRQQILSQQHFFLQNTSLVFETSLFRPLLLGEQRQT